MEDNKVILDQVEFVNKELKEGNSVAQVEKDLKLGKDTLRKQLNRAGYFFNKANKQFEFKGIKEDRNTKGITKQVKSSNENVDDLNGKIEELTKEFNIKIEGITKEVYSNKRKLQELLEMKDTNLDISNNKGIIINEVISMDKSNRKKRTFNMDLKLLDKLDDFNEKNISKSDVVNLAVKKYLIELGIIKE